MAEHHYGSLATGSPAPPRAGQKGPFGGGARGGAEHVAALLAAVATVAGKDALLSVADAVLDCAGALEALVAMLPQPPVTTGSVQPDAG